MKREVIEIRIDKKGNFTFLAKEGFAGGSCIDETREIELALNGNSTLVSTKKTKDYYRPDGSNPVNINTKK